MDNFVDLQIKYFDLDSMFSKLSTEMLVVFPTIIILFGIIEGLFGAKIYKAEIYISGFCAGFAAGAVGMDYVNKFYPIEWWVGLIICLFAGVIGCVILIRLFKLGLFLCSGAVGFIIAMSISGILWLSLIVFAVCGVVGMISAKSIVAFMTSLAGGFMIAGGISRLFSMPDAWIYPVIGGVLTIFFVLVQTHKRRGSDRRL